VGAHVGVRDGAQGGRPRGVILSCISFAQGRTQDGSQGCYGGG
jgi:hypothetical protein